MTARRIRVQGRWLWARRARACGGLWGEGADGAGHGWNDGEQDEGREEAEHQGEREADGGPAGFGLGLEPGSAWGGLSGDGAEGLGLRRAMG